MQDRRSKPNSNSWNMEKLKMNIPYKNTQGSTSNIQVLQNIKI